MIIMTSEDYVFAWNTYSESIKGIVQNLSKSDSFTDVTLVSDDKKQKRAHKFILSAVSDVFKNIIESVPDQNTCIYLKGVKYQELEAVLEFIYNGETKLSEEKMKDFLDVGISLEIKELKEINIKKENTLPSYGQNAATKNVTDQFQNVPNHLIDPVNEYGEEINSKNESNDNKIDAGTEDEMVNNDVPEQKIFKCNQCDYKSHVKPNLKQHIYSHHKGLKYTCNQ